MRHHFKYQLIFIVLLSFISACKKNTTMVSEVYYPEKNKRVAITETGELKSKNAVLICAPASWNLKYQITYLPIEGSKVHKRDTLVSFDTREVENRLNESLKKLESLEHQYTERRLTNAQIITDLKVQLESLSIQKKINKNRAEQAEYNSETDIKDADLELKKTDLNISKTTEALKAQKILNKNSENEILLQIEQRKTSIERNKKMIDDMFILAPKDGIVVYYQQGRRENKTKVKIGDTVLPQSPILQIPDLDNMIAEINLSEVDISKIKFDQNANIQIAAYSDSIFSGHVSFIAKIISFDFSVSESKTYPIEIEINSNQNFRLKPGLTAKIEIFIESIDDNFRVPCWCLFNNDNKFYVKNKSNFIPVKIKSITDGYAFITGNITDKTELSPNQNIPNF